MIKIYPNKNIKKQFEREGLSYPIKKSTKKYGIRGSTRLDADTILEAENLILQYLQKNEIIKVVQDD